MLHYIKMPSQKQMRRAERYQRKKEKYEAKLNNIREGFAQGSCACASSGGGYGASGLGNSKYYYTGSKAECSKDQNGKGPCGDGGTEGGCGKWVPGLPGRGLTYKCTDAS